MDCFNSDLFAWTTLTRTHSDSYAWQAWVAHTTLTCSLSQLWQAYSHNSNILTLTTNIHALTTLIYSLLMLWHVSYHCSDMHTVTSLTIWVWWEYADSGGKGFASRCETGFTSSGRSDFSRSQLAVEYLASLVAANLNSLWAGKKRWILLHFHNSDMLGLTALTCSLLPLWQSGFAGSKLVAVDLISLLWVKLSFLVAVDLALLGASWYWQIRLHW